MNRLVFQTRSFVDNSGGPGEGAEATRAPGARMVEIRRNEMDRNQIESDRSVATGSPLKSIERPDLAIEVVPRQLLYGR